MKKLLRSIACSFKYACTLLLFGVLVTNVLQAQTNPRFHFVAPAATINASFPGHTNAIGISLPGGYDIVEITSTNQAAFLTAAPTRIKYVFQQLQPGTVLRNRVNDVLRISGDTVKVNYMLVDDRTGINPGASGNFSAVPFTASGQDGRHHVWPTGNGFRNGAGAAAFQGRVRLGEYQMEVDQSHRVGGLSAIHELVLHETSHTQLVGRWTKWNGYITYGANGGHTINEILGDQEAPLNEGLGTFYGYTINPAGAAQLQNFFTRTDHRYVLEGESVSASYRELYTVATRQRRQVGTATVFDYKWLDVPDIFNMFNENNATGFFYYYWQNAYSNTDTAFAALNFAANAMWNERDTLKRYLTYVVNRLAVKMERYNGTAAGRADTSKTSSLFPFALLDLITHFGMTDASYKEDYDRNYPSAHPRAYGEYFNRRHEIRQLVQADINASPIRFNEAVQKIRNYCKQPAVMF